MDSQLYSEEDINEFTESCEAEELVPFSRFLEQEGLEPQVHKRGSKSKQENSNVDIEDQI